MDTHFRAAERVFTAIKAQHYLAADDERWMIAVAGRAWTLREHIHELRMQELAKVVRSHWHDPPRPWPPFAGKRVLITGGSSAPTPLESSWTHESRSVNCSALLGRRGRP